MKGDVLLGLGKVWNETLTLQSNAYRYDDDYSGALVKYLMLSYTDSHNQ